MCWMWVVILPLLTYFRIEITIDGTEIKMRLNVDFYFRIRRRKPIIHCSRYEGKSFTNGGRLCRIISTGSRFCKGFGVCMHVISLFLLLIGNKTASHWIHTTFTIVFSNIYFAQFLFFLRLTMTWNSDFQHISKYNTQISNPGLQFFCFCFGKFALFFCSILQTYNTYVAIWGRKFHRKRDNHKYTI